MKIEIDEFNQKKYTINKCPHCNHKLEFSYREWFSFWIRKKTPQKCPTCNKISRVAFPDSHISKFLIMSLLFVGFTFFTGKPDESIDRISKFDFLDLLADIFITSAPYILVIFALYCVVTKEVLLCNDIENENK